MTTGMSFIQSLVLDYTDHCATMSEGQKPLSLEGFFKQTTFYHGYGNWPTFFTIHTELGNKAELDQYMACLLYTSDAADDLTR